MSAGIRTVVPAHLRSIEKQLSDYGRRLRGKHGKGTKTHIKFDDGDRSIFLNVRLRDDQAWSRVYPEFARRWLKKLKNSDAEDLNRKLNLLPGPENDQMRPVSGRSDFPRPKAKSTGWSGYSEETMDEDL